MTWLHSVADAPTPLRRGFSFGGLYMHRIHLYSALFLLIVFMGGYSEPSRAEDYFWLLNGQALATGTRYSSPSVACDQYTASNTWGSHASSGSAFSSAKVNSVSLTSASTATCSITVTYKNGTTANFTRIFVRYGDSCTSPAVYNSETGACEEPKDECSSKEGQSFPFRKSGTAPDNYGTISSGYFIPRTEGCFEGCAASTADQKCKSSVSGAYACSGTGYYTGQACASAPEVDFTETRTDPTPETTSKEEPCNYTQQADGSITCNSSSTTETEGQHCGEVNGVKYCTDSKPTKNGIDISTNITTESNADGSSSSTKTDTATQTKCTGVQVCVSKTTTTTTTTKTNANGSTSSVSGTCTGDNCASNTNPDADGDGLGDCVTDCDDSTAGPSGSLQQGEEGNFDEGNAEWDQRIEDARAELDEKLAEYTALFKGVFELNLSTGGGSLPCETFSIHTGSATLRLCPADYSEQLSYLRYVILLAAAVLAALIVLRD